MSTNALNGSPCSAGSLDPSGRCNYDLSSHIKWNLTLVLHIFSCKYKYNARASNLITEVNIGGYIVFFLMSFSFFPSYFFRTLVEYRVVIYFSLGFVWYSSTIVLDFIVPFYYRIELYSTRLPEFRNLSADVSKHASKVQIMFIFDKFIPHNKLI